MKETLYLKQIPARFPFDKKKQTKQNTRGSVDLRFVFDLDIHGLTLQLYENLPIVAFQYCWTGCGNCYCPLSCMYGTVFSFNGAYS